MEEVYSGPLVRDTRQRTAEVAVIVGFWLFLGALVVLRRALDPRGPDSFATAGMWISIIEYALWAVATPGVFWLARQFSLERGSRLRSVLLHLGVALIVAAVFEILKEVVLRPYFFGSVDISRFGRYGRELREPDALRSLVQLRFIDELVVYLAVLAAGFARDAFVKLRVRQEEAARLTAQLSRARLDALRMQLNPHFLFNTLHAVSALVDSDPAGVRRMIAKLSGLLRHALDSDSAQEVPLSEELQFLRGFLDIQQVRFQGKLEIEEDVPPDLLGALVPNLILQPLIENAVEHGTSSAKDGGRVTISAAREGAYLILAVQDNGQGLPEDAQTRSNGVGIQNTRARLDALYGREGTLTLENARTGGLRATIRLPFHTSGDLFASQIDAAD